MTLRQPARLGALIALAGAVISAYLTSVKLQGELPTCGPLRGCETVALSSYSEIGGVPVALFGLAFSLVILGLNLVWWRFDAPMVRSVAYGLGLFGVLFVAYLTYLELFVIHAVCVWCVAYAVTVIAGWVVAAVGVRSG